MNLFGLEIRRSPAGLQPVYSSGRGSWWPLIREPFTGAWQRNMEWTRDTVLAHHAVYACITQIATDLGTLRPMLVEEVLPDVWKETSNTAHSPVLRRPNRFQNHIQFKEWWAMSKLTNGNVYGLKERDNRGVVSAIYILDSSPGKVTVLVAPDGSVLYNLKTDNLAGIEEDEIAVPASEIIHDRINCLFHPLVGTSPIFACGAAANLGLKIQNNSSTFFGNGSLMSGVLSAAQDITPEKSEQLSQLWNARFGPNGQGGVAVLGSGMKYEKMQMTATDAQLIDQLKWSAETVCSVFHVPAWKVGIRPQPAYTKPEIANQAYYSDCLRAHIEQYELCMDEGLGIGVGQKIDGRTLGVELETEVLFRMDAASQISTLKEAVGGSIYTVNEARAKVDLEPVDGGDEIWMQQQNFSLPALAKRDESSDPFGIAKPTLPAPEPQKQIPAPAEDNARSVEAGWFVREYMDKSFEAIRNDVSGRLQSIAEKLETRAVLKIPALPAPEPEEEEDSLEMWSGWFARDSLAIVREAKEFEQRTVSEAIERSSSNATVEALGALTATVAELATREQPTPHVDVHVASPEVRVSQPPITVEVKLEPSVGKTVTKEITLKTDQHGVPTGASVTEITD